MIAMYVIKMQLPARNRQKRKLAKQELLSYNQPESPTVTTSKGCSRRIADLILACSQRGRSVIISGVDPLSAMRHPYEDSVPWE